jgi:uncharacterized protein YjbI with pentapeptide repeats
MGKESNNNSGRKFSQSQYDMLKRCSEAEDVAEWNDWRKANPDDRVLLEEAVLEKFHLSGVNLQDAFLRGANLQGANLERANLQKAKLWNANLQKAIFSNAKLQGANLQGANLQEAKLVGADLQKARFHEANLQGVWLWTANLREANLSAANLQQANLLGADLQGARFEEANLKAAKLTKAKLQKADFRKAIVDGETLIWGCEIDRETNFGGVGLGAIRLQPGVKQLLQYNNRRRNWTQWYGEHRFLQWPVKWFWALSDYGVSTGRVLKSFTFFALAFALIYYVWGCVDVYGLKIEDRPGLISNLFAIESTYEAVAPNQVPVRSVYFSVITMTTLGFGDMYANPATVYDDLYMQIRGVCGHVLLMMQVLLGYIMLGALVTRFAVLFEAGGPAGKFATEEK